MLHFGKTGLPLFRARRPRAARRLAAWSAAVTLGLLAVPDARAVSFALDVEFDSGAVGRFARVDVTEKSGALDFTICLDAALGPDADLHVFYFNLVGNFSGLVVSSADAVTKRYALVSAPSVAGGAGSAFDFGVDFGNGASKKGNGVLQKASFTLSAKEPLTLADLLQTSSASGKKIVVHAAAHVQGTSLFKGATSETVGGLVPEPSVALLLAGGLGGLAFFGRRRRGAAPR